MSKISIDIDTKLNWNGSAKLKEKAARPTEREITEALQVSLLTLKDIKNLEKLIEVVKVDFLQSVSGICSEYPYLSPGLETRFEIILVNPINKEKISVQSSNYNRAVLLGDTMSVASTTASFIKKILEHVEREIKSARLAADKLESMLLPAKE